AARNRHKLPSASSPRNIQAAWRARSPTEAGRPLRSGRRGDARPHARRTACHRRRIRKPCTACDNFEAAQGKAQALIAVQLAGWPQQICAMPVDGSRQSIFQCAVRSTERNLAMTLATAAQSATWTFVDGDWYEGNVAILGPRS